MYLPSGEAFKIILVSVEENPGRKHANASMVGNITMRLSVYRTGKARLLHSRGIFVLPYLCKCLHIEHREKSGQSSRLSSCASCPLLSFLSLLATFIIPSSPCQWVNTAAAVYRPLPPKVASVLIGDYPLHNYTWQLQQDSTSAGYPLAQVKHIIIGTSHPWP